MDYWKQLDLQIHDDWEAFMACADGPKRLWLFTTKGSVGLWDARFAAGDGLIFGSEGAGAPEWLHEQVGEARRVGIPRFGENLRSLNLSTSAGIGVYEALRQMRAGNAERLKS